MVVVVVMVVTTGGAVADRTGASGGDEGGVLAARRAIVVVVVVVVVVVAAAVAVAAVAVAVTAAAAAVGVGLKREKAVVEKKRTHDFIRLATLTGADGQCTITGWRVTAALDSYLTTTTRQHVYGKHDRSSGIFRRWFENRDISQRTRFDRSRRP